MNMLIMVTMINEGWPSKHALKQLLMMMMMMMMMMVMMMMIIVPIIGEGLASKHA